MAWKLSRNQELDSGNWSGFIEQGVRVEGRLELPGIFRVDGEIKGTIISERSLILGENSMVEGKIEARHLSIAGRFEGIIFAKERVEVKTKAIVTGEIHTPCLVLEAGAIFDGNCHMIAAAPAAKTIEIPIRSGTQG